MANTKIDVNNIIKKHNIHEFKAQNALRSIAESIMILEKYGFEIELFNKGTGEEYRSRP